MTIILLKFHIQNTYKKRFKWKKKINFRDPVLTVPLFTWFMDVPIMKSIHCSFNQSYCLGKIQENDSRWWFMLIFLKPEHNLVIQTLTCCCVACVREMKNADWTYVTVVAFGVTKKWSYLYESRWEFWGITPSYLFYKVLINLIKRQRSHLCHILQKRYVQRHQYLKR